MSGDVRKHHNSNERDTTEGLHVSLINWVEQGTDTPKDRDEVKRRDV